MLQSVIIEAGDAATAFKLTEKIDLILTNVGLPAGRNGRKLADAVLQMRPNLPAVFITLYAEKAVLNDGDLDKRTRVLIKPFATERLAEIVREMIAISSH